MPIPPLGANGVLPPGEHEASMEEIEQAFGSSTDRRKVLMNGLKLAVENFQAAGVPRIYIDGSFTADKPDPNDIDGCWSAVGASSKILDPVFWKASTPEERRQNRLLMKQKYGLDFFMAESREGRSGKNFPDFFQTDRNGNLKGILKVNLAKGGV